MVNEGWRDYDRRAFVVLSDSFFLLSMHMHMRFFAFIFFFWSSSSWPLFFLIYVKKTSDTVFREIQIFLWL